MYRHAKVNFEYAPYLGICNYKKYRHGLTRLRLSAHSLRIQTGKYGQNRIPRHERTCQYCTSGDIEDEYHFMIVCDRYTELRTKYISRYYRHNPSMYKFIQLLQSSNRKVVNNLSYYIYHANMLRSNMVAN